tara:strand:- start:318 stop:650 length:333 start_codon:yes stop_codon:yes gene_type:complete
MLLEQKKYMGQVIEVNYKQLGRDLILDLNRTISGQEGISFNNISEASLDKTFSGEMALSLFRNFDDIVSIHILSNSVTISFARNIGTDVNRVKELISEFFIHYKDSGEEE